ncbi:MAG: sterol carrier protein [Firmicutes bacterium]|nr:sterol carrier protein [Bacillota bacterium]
MSDAHPGLEAALADFSARCNADARLVTMNRDWNRTVLVAPADGAAGPYWIRTREGQVSWGQGEPEWDLRIEGPAAVLEAVFSGRMTPTEPYDNGDLLVKGSQEDLLRLDVITLLLWGE